MNPVLFLDLKSQYKELKNDIDNAINKVLDHGQFILGPEVEECEAALSKYIGSKHALTCASGTDAAIMALMALNIGPGDEVIVPAFSFIATAECVVLVGATPVFVDVDPVTYNLDTKQLESVISKKTKAIMPVSLYGQPADMDEINTIAAKHSLAVIEDAAQSFGADYKGKKSCALSTIGVTSFFPAKPLGCYGDGGAIFTDDSGLHEKMKKIRVHGQSARYYHDMLGVNGRLDTLQCAILLPKLKKFPWEVKRRQEIAEAYNRGLTGLQGMKIPVVKSDRTSAWAQYTIEVDNRDSLQKRLQELGIPTAVHYPRTMADQPAYTQYRRTLPTLKASELAAQRVLSLPLHPYLTNEHVQRVIDAVVTAFKV